MAAKGEYANGETTEHLINRFYRNVRRDTITGCWIWIGYTQKSYGRFSILNKSWLAHRVSYYLAYDELPDPPYHVLHRCNTKLCVNPDHLYKGTDADNKLDQANTGIQYPNKIKKLTDSDILKVLELKNQGYTQRQIADIMNVSQWYIWNVLNNLKME